MGEDTIRQARYADRQTLRYTFVLANDGLPPIKVTGLAEPELKPTLFDYKMWAPLGHLFVVPAPKVPIFRRC